jgi:sphingomyelin phosphodiesterase 2
LKLHANYAENDASDSYLAHRIGQAFELSQFINQTSSSCDIVVLLGDLNLTSDELGFKLVKNNSNLLDTFSEAKVSKKKHFESCQERI